MLEFIQGVAEEVLRDQATELAFEVCNGQLISTVRSNGKSVQNTQMLQRATSRSQGNAVGSNLLAAL